MTAISTRYLTSPETVGTQPTTCRQIFTIALLCVFFSSVTWLRFRPWMPQVLAADDLYNFMLYHGDRFTSPMSPIYFSETGQKFRFVFSNAVRVESFLFGPHPQRYFILNVAIHAISCTALCFLAASLSGSWWAAVVLASIAATTRFALYQVSHLTGQVESLSLMFSLLCILAAKKSIDRDWSEPWKWVALLMAFLAFSSHERYVVLLAWLGLLFVLCPRAGSFRCRAAFFVAGSLLVVSNVLTKIFVYKANVLEGTGNTPLSVNITSIKELLSQAVLSIFGINHGPQYLTGAEWADFSTSIRIISVIFAVILLLLVIAAFAEQRRYSTDGNANWPLAFVLLTVLLLVPPALTIRLEQRWEVAPFFMLLLVAASGIAQIRTTGTKQKLLPVLLGGLLLCAAVIEARVSQSFGSVFYVYGDTYAAAAKRAIIDTRSSAPGTPIVLVSPPSNCGGTLLDGGFFLIYEGVVRRVYCVGSKDAASAVDYPVGTRLFESPSTDSLVDVTDGWNSQRK
jgi:hypothetical protein